MKEPVKVDDRIIHLLEYGKEVSSLSGGKTNIFFRSGNMLWAEAQEQASPR
jgi:thiamine biosynthesis lipoprotein ApbE